MAKKAKAVIPAKGKQTQADPKTAAKAKRDVGTAMVLPTVKASAMSVDVGPVVLAAIGAYTRDERQIGELRKSVEQKQYEALARMTAGIVKAAKADASIRLEQVFVGDKAAKAKMNNQIYLALGLKHVVSVFNKKTGEATDKHRFTWTPEAAKLVEPNETDPKDIATQKGTIRTNLAHMLTKCTQAAVGIVDDNLTMNVDKASGTLMLAGPSIKKHFGEASVLLNEKQTVPINDKKTGEKIGEKQLNAKPSFTEIARRAAEAHGKVQQTRVQSGIAHGVTVDANKHIMDLCGMLLKAVNALKEVTSPVKAALESLNNAIDAKLV